MWRRTHIPNILYNANNGTIPRACAINVTKNWTLAKRSYLYIIRTLLHAHAHSQYWCIRVMTERPPRMHIIRVYYQVVYTYSQTSILYSMYYVTNFRFTTFYVNYFVYHIKMRTAASIWRSDEIRDECYFRTHILLHHKPACVRASEERGRVYTCI